MTLLTTTAPPPQRPCLGWRSASSMIMGLSGLVAKGFLYGFNSVEVIGMQRFLDVLDSRRDMQGRKRGLITVSNHISILDDPLIWGVLPARYAFDPANMRWALAAEDICFKNRMLAKFFNLGQTLSTHRFKHSPHGGMFQPTISEAIRLLSSPSHPQQTLSPATWTGGPNAAARFRPWGSHAWIHVFPEGCVHQQPERGLRYFKWGVARLILESESSSPSPSSPVPSGHGGSGDGAQPPFPDVVPMFIDGTDRIMPEDRGFPRFLPRVGKRVRVVFGEPLDGEAVFGDLRRRWRDLVASTSSSSSSSPTTTKKEKSEPVSRKGPRTTEGSWDLESLHYQSSHEDDGNDPLRHGEEAQAIRIELARRLRDEVLKLRRGLGYPNETDPKLELAETWARDPGVGYTYRSKVDGSIISQR